MRSPPATRSRPSGGAPEVWAFGLRNPVPQQLRSRHRPPLDRRCRPGRARGDRSDARHRRRRQFRLERRRRARPISPARRRPASPCRSPNMPTAPARARAIRSPAAMSIAARSRRCAANISSPISSAATSGRSRSAGSASARRWRAASSPCATPISRRMPARSATSPASASIRPAISTSSIMTGRFSGSSRPDSRGPSRRPTEARHAVPVSPNSRRPRSEPLGGRHHVRRPQRGEDAHQVRQIVHLDVEMEGVEAIRRARSGPC